MMINCKGKLVDLNQPVVMGIMNVTPDSFFDGGKYTTAMAIEQRAAELIEQGATFIDVGGYSSRPGALPVSETEEIDRVIHAIKIILQRFPEALISVDTFRSTVAAAAVGEGACFVNDISGGDLDSAMFDTIAKLQVPYCLMHMRGTPQNMAAYTDYQDLIADILHYFSGKIARARAAGINDLLLDPGFGFAKNTEQNFVLLENLQLFCQMQLPVLVGISRKSMVYKTLQINPEHALNGSTALHMIALDRGATVLRVHDVAEAVQCVQLFKVLKKDKQL